MNTAKVAIVGFGTIGSGVAKLLLEHGSDFAACRQARATGLRGRFRPEPPAKLTFPPGLLTNDLAKMLADKDVVAVVQTVGGWSPSGHLARCWKAART